MPKKVQKKGGGGEKPADRALGPAAEAFGKEIVPLGKEAGELTNQVGLLLVRTARNLVYGVGNSWNWIQEHVAKRLKDVPPEKIIEPNPRIAVPAMQALTYSMDEKHIRELFADLLAADMNTDTKALVHPAFVEAIKEMTPVDARVLPRAQGTEYQVRITIGKGALDLEKVYSIKLEGVTDDEITLSLTNLQRLGLVELRSTFPLRTSEQEEVDIKAAAEKKHEGILNSEHFPQIGMLGMSPGQRPSLSLVKRGIYLTPLGTRFVSICGKQG